MIKSRRKLVRKVRAKAYNRKIEIEYARELLAISALCQQQGESSWKLAQSFGFIGDSIHLGDAPSWLNSIANSFSDLGKKVRSISNNLASKVVYGQADLTDKEIATYIRQATGIEIEGLVSPSKLNAQTINAINSNVSLIESIPKEYHQRLERILLSGLQENRSQDYIAEQIKKLGNITDARARLIARDQAGSLASQFSEIRLKALGFKSYLWETKGDSKVRYEHARRQGVSFDFDDPPYDGHAGQAINCRCRKMPDMKSLMNSETPVLLQQLIRAGNGLLNRS